MKSKKSLSILLLLVMTMALPLTACSSLSKTNSSALDNSSQTASAALAQLETSASVSATTVPTATVNPAVVNTIGLYMPNKALGVRELTAGYTGEWISGKDIASFEAFATQEAVISGINFKSVWESYWNHYPESSGYKIGYYLSFTLNSSEVITKTIKKYEDTNDFREYLELYLYDDVHQIQGNWYSHLTTADTHADSVCTSIKLTAGSKISEIKSISLTVFTYSGDKDFNTTNGTYIGNNSYKIPISRTK